jgi:arylsulfatase A-like enzyme
MSLPNIVFILIDDMGWKDLGCYGSRFYETPNLDRLATESMRFTNAYASCPVCSPTRASILSGKYPATVGVTNYIAGCSKGKLLEAPYIKHLPLEEKSIAASLRGAGYTTWHIGKWHLGNASYYPENHGFDINIGGCSWGHPHKGYFSPWHIETLEDGPDGEYLTDRLTDDAINLIRNNDGKPFFLNLWYYTVHTPIQAKAEKIAKYEAKAKDMGLDTVKTFEEGENFPTECKRHLHVRRRLVQSDPAYAAMIESLDDNIGRLLEVLEETGQADNTIVIFTSDNGGLATSEGSPTCNAPLAEGKGWMYEGGTREPLFIKWPGKIEPGTTCDTPVTSPDFYPTLLEAAGLEAMPGQHCDGESIMPLLTQTGTLERDAIFWHYPHYGNQGGTPGSSIRCGDYKLIEFFEDGRLELYNLAEDISEEHNLANEKPEMTKELHAKLVAWRQKVEAKIPTPNPDWQE